MREALEAVVAWRRAGVRAALATVVAVEGSGPREPGTMMAVSERAEVVGSVSGGCVEGAVVAEALARLDAPEAVLASIGITGSVERGGHARLWLLGRRGHRRRSDLWRYVPHSRRS